MQLDFQGRDVFASVCRKASFPLVISRVNQFQAFAYLFQPDSRTAFVGAGFGVIAVPYGAMYLVFRFAYGNADETGFGGGYAMLECVFYQ